MTSRTRGTTRPGGRPSGHRHTPAGPGPGAAHRRSDPSTERYQARMRALVADRSAGEARRRNLSAQARARSAARWADEHERTHQERRAAALRLITM